MAYKKSNANGQATMANSEPVVIASDQSAITVDLGANNDVTVTGSVTANAGTNLNTSALATEAGGNLAAIKAKTDNIPALGQALAAASVPVILPAATITTLTPPAAITGFATAANQLPDGHNVTVDNASLTVDLGANNDVTVTGTVDLGATDNAVLDSIAAKDFATQTTLAAMNAKMVTGTDIGDVTINNSTGAAAVNIQDGGNSITVDNGGTFAVQAAATLAAETTKVIGTVRVASGGIASGSLASGSIASGAIAAGAIAAGNTSIATTEDTARAGGEHLVKIGAVRVDTPPAGANVGGSEDYTNVIVDNFGAQWVHPLPVSADLATMATPHVKKYYTNAGAVTDGIIWSPAAGKRWFVTDIYIQVSAAATVTLEDDLAGGDSPVWKAELAANSGWSHSFNTPLMSGEDAADLIITTTAGNVYVTCVGYEI